MQQSEFGFSCPWFFWAKVYSPGSVLELNTNIGSRLIGCLQADSCGAGLLQTEFGFPRSVPEGPYGARMEGMQA